MRRDIRSIVTVSVLGAPLVLAACAVAPPSGPTVMALPGQGRSLTAFQQDDVSCRGYAGMRTNYQQPGQAGANGAIGGAGIGTALGAAAGAALGAIGGNAGAGAAIGGATGLIGGTSVGANNAAAGEFDLQTRYNIAYTQCMYARGDSVQSAPPGYRYSGYGGPGYGYGYGYGAPWGYPYYGTGFWGPSLVVGFGGGYGRGYGYGGYGRGYGYGGRGYGYGGGGGGWRGSWHH